MKATGIVRRVDDLDKIVELQDTLEKSGFACVFPVCATSTCVPRMPGI